MRFILVSVLVGLFLLLGGCSQLTQPLYYEQGNTSVVIQKPNVSHPYTNTSPPTNPEINSTINPARDVTGTWVGTGSFVEDNIFTGVASGEVLCSFSGKFTFVLYQKGNDVIGYYNKGDSPVWSEYLFAITDTKSTVVSATGTVPPAGCVIPVNGFLDNGIDSGVVSSSGIKLSSNGKEVFSGSFTSDIMNLELTNCLLPSGDSCMPKDSAKWKITLARQR